MAALKDIRSLTALVTSASTARVLNLARAAPPGAPAKPLAGRTLFDNSALDRSIIVKHRLRPHERDWFDTPRAIATKVLIPIDPGDLNNGAHTFMIGQRGCEQLYAEALSIAGGSEKTSRDMAVLGAIDELPTLDPFLTREHLKRRGIQADDRYFEIAAADLERMFDFVRGNIVPLVELCFGAGVKNSTSQAQRLAQKILAADMDATMDPLRLTLKMNDEEFLESIFCWKGFLYYKWVLSDNVRQAFAVASAIETVRVKGKPTLEEGQYILAARDRLKAGIQDACRKVKSALDSYDAAFDALTLRADPVAFRDFLLSAPAMFFEVGERLGAIQHITSFWKYRFPNAKVVTTPPDLFDILVDFENGLGISGKRQQTWD